MITPRQLKAARAILGLSQADVATMTSKTTKTVRRAETDRDGVSEATIAGMQAALEAAGVVFIPSNGNGAGVRLRNPDRTDGSGDMLE